MSLLINLPISLILLLTSCKLSPETNQQETKKLLPEIKKIRDIPLPEGFSLMNAQDSLYSQWLLNLQLKSSKIVHLYDGSEKQNQHVQFAVLDIDIGQKDLIQCADAAIKLYADYLFQSKKYADIKFTATSGTLLSFTEYKNGKRWKPEKNDLIAYFTSTNNGSLEDKYNSFMKIVFSYCGTYSLNKQLVNVKQMDSIMPGDIFIHGGFPGHAVTVMAIAGNGKGKKIFLLSQGYMPAQDIHILKNYNNSNLSPWYEVNTEDNLNTPQWAFYKGSLKRWQK